MTMPERRTGDANRFLHLEPPGMRFVIYHPEKLIFLGFVTDAEMKLAPAFSHNNNSKDFPAAPTFEREQGVNFIRESQLEGCSLKIVFPHGTNNMATPEDCANAALVRW